MRNIHIADWILGLVTSRDRAASTAGDLAEEAANRGTVWFWSGVFRTAGSLLWHDVAERPARITGLAFLGLAVYIAIDLLFAGLSGLAFFVAAMAGGHPVHLADIVWKLWSCTPIVVSSLLIGRILARGAPGRELAACLVYAIVASVYNVVPMFGDNGGFAAFLSVAIALAGAAWGRYRRIGASLPKPV